MSIPRIIVRPAFPSHSGPGLKHAGENSGPDSLDSFVLLAQASGPLPAPAPAKPPKLKLLDRETLLRQSPPENIKPVQLEIRLRFANAREVDDFLKKNQRGLEIKVDGRSIGETVASEPAVSESIAQAITKTLKRHFGSKKLKDPGSRSERILERVREFVLLNQKVHAEIDFYERLLYLGGKDAAGRTVVIQPQARGLLEQRIKKLKDILYQSYRRVLGRLLRKDPGGRSQDKALIHARLMLVTGGTDSNRQKLADRFWTDQKIKPAEGEEADENNLKRLLGKIRSVLARNWYQDERLVIPPMPSVAAAPADAPPDDLDRLLDGAITNEDRIAAGLPPRAPAAEPQPPAPEPEEEGVLVLIPLAPPAPPRPPAPSPLRRPTRVAGTMTAEQVERLEALQAGEPLEEDTLSADQQTEIAALKARVEEGVLLSLDEKMTLFALLRGGPQRTVEAWGHIGPLSGSRIWNRPPRLGTLVSDKADEVELREEVNRNSESNSHEAEAAGISAGAEVNIHPGAHLGKPFGALFVLAGLEAGFAGSYNDPDNGTQSIGFVEGRFGLGLNLARLFRSDPELDLVVRAAVLRAGYNNFHGGYSDAGSYGACGRYEAWQACLDFSSIYKGSESSQERPGIETKELKWLRLSIGRFFY